MFLTMVKILILEGRLLQGKLSDFNRESLVFYNSTLKLFYVVPAKIKLTKDYYKVVLLIKNNHKIEIKSKTWEFFVHSTNI